jgi:hypothetical protein
MTLHVAQSIFKHCLTLGKVGQRVESVTHVSGLFCGPLGVLKSSCQSATGFKILFLISEVQNIVSIVLQKQLPVWEALIK